MRVGAGFFSIESEASPASTIGVPVGLQIVNKLVGLWVVAEREAGCAGGQQQHSNSIATEPWDDKKA